MATTVNLRASGLVTSPNQLSLPEGSLSEATNVIIRRDNVVESRRGYKIYGNAMGSPSDRAKQLWSYKQRIIRHYGSIIEFQNGFNNDGSVKFSAFSGSFSETEPGLRIKHIESNGNQYFTTGEGIKKISAKTASDFSTSSNYITNAGGIKALDLTTELEVTPGDQTSFFLADSALAYRVVWGSKDKNDNLILGTPSQRSEIYNPLSSLLVLDLMNVLIALDETSYAGGSLINDGDYVNSLKLPSSASGTELKANLVLLASKIDNDLLYANTTGIGVPLTITTCTIASGVATINFSAPNATDYFISGSKIYLYGFSPAAGTLDGAQTIATVTATSITFNTTATGAVTVAGAATIVSNEYRSITQPGTIVEPATHAELVEIQDYVSSIITRLQEEPSTGTPASISASSQTIYITPLEITTTATVKLRITIPDAVTANNFFQIYRSDVTQALDQSVLSTDVFPSDELKLVYEAYPTSAELAAKEVVVQDITPDEFRGANLYTNPSSGEGILQSNDIPPFAKDINRFKNVVFYANTKTLHRLSLNLIGVVGMVSDYNNGNTPQIMISDGTTTSIYSFVTGLQQITTLDFTGATAAGLDGTYLFLNSAENKKEYYVWFNLDNSSTDPAPAGKTGIKVDIITGDSDTVIAQKTRDVLNTYIFDFSAASLLAVVTVTCLNVGYTNNASDGTTGITINTTQSGRGEDYLINQVLLSEAVSPATAVDETARSLVRVINKNSSSSINAYYLSGADDVPGKMLLEADNLASGEFYIMGNNSTTGNSFNPSISPDLTINNISIGAISTIQTSNPHGLVTGDNVLILNSDSTPSIDGFYSVTFVSSTQFSIVPASAVTVAGTTGAAISATNAINSDNEEKSNRVYYSKLQQPEAVPIVNYFDVGDSDKEIVRIFPLRDSLFVFKEEGLYRISGESAPFTLALFDSSCQLIAPDTLDVANNQLFGLTTQGVISVTESGVTIISRNIDIDILKIPTYSDFKTLSWGVGYESDNSYTLYTITRSGETSATWGYRYSTLTNSWTNIDKSVTCGFVNLSDDKLYLGAADTNYIEQERKSFNRYDYADREISTSLSLNNYNDTKIKIPSIENINIGDVLVQEQTLTVYTYNQLLKKLDLDTGLNFNDYYSTLVASGGNDMRVKLVALATKLDADISGGFLNEITTKFGNITSISEQNPSIITTSAPHGLVNKRIVIISGSDSTPTINGNYAVTILSPTTFSIDEAVTIAGTTGAFITADSNFEDIRICYNKLIQMLNADPNVAFGNYTEIEETTIQESIITDINPILNIITVNLKLDYVVGPMTVFNAIACSLTYSPNTMGDPMGFKHLREATIMFAKKAFTSAQLAFATDLLPEFIQIDFNGDGSGIFGHQPFGTKFFGGASNSAPFRTYIPRQCQRCRFIETKFSHRIAREEFAIFGISITGEVGISTRAYR